MASSTADVIAVARAIAAARHTQFTDEQMGALAARVEHSTGVMYEGAVAFNQMTGELIERYEWSPRFAVIVIVPDDKLDVHAVSLSDDDRLVSKYEGLLQDYMDATQHRNASLVAAIATKAASIHQQIIPNPLFAHYVNQLPRLGAAGIALAHTGSLIGLLYPAYRDGNIPHVVQETAERIAASWPAATVKVTQTPTTKRLAAVAA
jgi:L-threonine kinase